MAKLDICESCKQKLLDMLDARMVRILEVGREEAAHGNGGEDGDIGQSQCFHLMEIQRVITGQNTCGVYDDFGPDKTIEGPLFTGG